MYLKLTVKHSLKQRSRNRHGIKSKRLKVKLLHLIPVIIHWRLCWVALLAAVWIILLAERRKGERVGETERGVVSNLQGSPRTHQDVVFVAWQQPSRWHHTQRRLPDNAGELCRQIMGDKKERKKKKPHRQSVRCPRRSFKVTRPIWFLVCTAPIALSMKCQSGTAEGFHCVSHRQVGQSERSDRKFTIVAIRYWKTQF